MCTYRHIMNNLLHLVWLVFYLPDVRFSKILISEAASVKWTDSWSTRQSSRTRSDQLCRTDGSLVLCCWWSLSSWSLLHTRLVGLHERSPVQNSPPRPAPRSRSPSGTRGALLNHPEQMPRKHRDLLGFHHWGVSKCSKRRSSKQDEWFSIQVVCVCKCVLVNVHRSANSWSNSTWQESLPPSWYPAQIMSYRMSTCSFGSIWYISWHELWEMIGTSTSCSVPIPGRGTEGTWGRTEDEEKKKKEN